MLRSRFGGAKVQNPPKVAKMQRAQIRATAKATSTVGLPRAPPRVTNGAGPRAFGRLTTPARGPTVRRARA
eukprot:9384921-Lingulodinium_polyedra.AAC.1